MSMHLAHSREILPGIGEEITVWDDETGQAITSEVIDHYADGSGFLVDPYGGYPLSVEWNTRHGAYWVTGYA